MKNSRRKILQGGFGAVAGLAAANSKAADSCGGMTREDYDRYVSLFNANDWRFLDYYHPDVVLELGSDIIEGPEGIRELYTPVKQHIRETVEVTRFISDESGIAVVIPTTFECIADWEDSFWGIPLKAGEVLRIVSWGMYEVEDNMFRHIRAVRSEMINDWQMEG